MTYRDSVKNYEPAARPPQRGPAATRPEEPVPVLKERLAQVRDYVLHDAGGSLRDRVYRALRAAILARSLVGGDRITELDLATTLNVSRTPLREAFRLLQAEGLVSLSDRRGIVVRGLGAQDFLEIYEIRASLDALVARKAAQCRDPEFLRKLRDNLEMSEFLLQRERWTELREEFLRFHKLVQDVCGNARLRDLLEDLQEYSNSSPALTRATPRHAPDTLADHLRIYEAIVAGDAEAAAIAATEHVQNERLELLRVQSAAGHAEDADDESPAKSAGNGGGAKPAKAAKSVTAKPKSKK
jgi:DNA-binding GntR family transcriptional regulator